MNQQTKKLNQINNQLDSQVNAENQEAFTNMVCYLRGSNLSEYHQELIRHDLLEMIVSAQQRGETIQTVIGEDYQVFCDDIIASLPPKTTKQKILDFLDILCGGLSILFAINLIVSKDISLLLENFFTGKPVSFQISVSIGTVLSIGIILAAAFLIVKIITKNSLKPSKKQSSPGKGKLFFIGLAVFSAFLFLAWVGRATFFTVNLFAAVIFTLMLYVAHKILSKFDS